MTTVRIYFNGTPYDVDSDLIDFAKTYLLHECASKADVIEMLHGSGCSVKLATAIVSEAERQLSLDNPAQS